MAATNIEGPSFITAALTCTDPECKSHLDTITVSLYQVDKDLGTYDTQYNIPFFPNHLLSQGAGTQANSIAAALVHTSSPTSSSLVDFDETCDNMEFSTVSVPVPVPVPVPAAFDTMTLSQHTRWLNQLHKYLQPDNIRISLLPHETEEDVARVIDLPTELQKFAQYKLNYHIYVHFLAEVRGFSISEAAAEIETRRWRVSCERMGNGCELDLVGERRGAVSEGL
ncbi:hypothetical protein BJX70DRAFT_401255 [Aspergillus crustosus]